MLGEERWMQEGAPTEPGHGEMSAVPKQKELADGRYGIRFAISGSSSEISSRPEFLYPSLVVSMWDSREDVRSLPGQWNPV